MALIYIKMRWPDQKVPADCPEWLYYEVDSDSDNVLRSVEVFGDGRSQRNSLQLESRHWSAVEIVSICHGPFSDILGRETHEFISTDQFAKLFERAMDKPLGA